MLTAAALAARLGVSRTMIHIYAKAGRIAGATRHGRAWAFPDDATVSPPPPRQFMKIGRQGPIG